MKDQVIKVLNKKHGRKVIKYFKSQGVDTVCWVGSITLKKWGELAPIYYGVIDGKWNIYTIDMVKSSNVPIIKLPDKTYKVGETIEVRSNKNDTWVKRIFLCKNKTNVLCVCLSHENDFKEKMTFSTSFWKYSRPINIPEYTMKEAIEKMGHEFKIKE